ncbi:MAG: DUF2934 domain-containing protein [Elainellaceae cyanobacterium]
MFSWLTNLFKQSEDKENGAATQTPTESRPTTTQATRPPQPSQPRSTETVASPPSSPPSSPPFSPPSSNGASEEAIRLQAYYLWEADGKPDGKADYYWKKAVEDVQKN